ncbi:DUF2490 domain-containing protein [Mariniflexile aquimaris]|uniref:DUF2490 domain-containing protein n=1 Tax=Mariniflexile aquimaris TaxID=881009 RepID=A0ABW3BWQ9_9FLAO
MKHRYLLVNVLLIIILGFRGYAQKNIETQSLLWMRYNLGINFNENYKLRYEIEERVYHAPWRQHQFLSKAHFERRLNNNWNCGVGFTYLVQSLPHSAELDVTETQIELRPQLEIENKQKLFDRLSISHRYWTEFRFFEQADNSFDFSNIRTRYKLELNYKVSDKITFKAFDEIHLNIGNKIVQNVFDQNRYGGSIQVMPSKSLGFELGYFNWFQQKKSGTDFYNRNIIRVTIHQNINI